jgi:hypothetical protein
MSWILCPRFGRSSIGTAGHAICPYFKSTPFSSGRQTKEVSLDELEEVADDGSCGDLALLVAVVVEEAVEEHLLERLVVDTPELLELGLFGRQGPIVAGRERHGATSSGPPFSGRAGSRRSARRSLSCLL